MSKALLSAVVLLTMLSGCWQKNIGLSYYPSGKIRSEATVKNNVLDGLATSYYESGTKMSEATYLSGILHGQAFSYYEHGPKQSAAQYKNGVLHGTSARWDKDGTLVDEVNFVDGRLIPKD